MPIPIEKKPPLAQRAVPERQSVVSPANPTPVRWDHTEASCGLEDVMFLRLPKVMAVTGLAKTSLYELIREKSFPPPVRLGTRTVAWVRSEVTQWVAERISSSRAAKPDSVGRRTPQRALGQQRWAASRKSA